MSAAIRQNGVCRGLLWKQHCAIPGSGSGENKPSVVVFSIPLNKRNERDRRNEYCTLVGNVLRSYLDAGAYNRGEYPLTEVRIVGASAWNPPTRGTVGSLFSKVGKSAAKKNALNKVSGGTGSHDSGGAFRIVTYGGTHVYCSAPSNRDRDVWLSSLHSGLEASYTAVNPSYSMKSANSGDNSMSSNQCRKCHASLKNEKEDKGNQSISEGKQIRLMDKLIGKSSALHSMTNSQRMANIGKQKDQSKRQIKYCLSCGSTEPLTRRGSSATTSVGSSSAQKSVSHRDLMALQGESPTIHLINNACPLVQQSLELSSGTTLCQFCLVGQGLLHHIEEMNGFYAAYEHERTALRAARDMALESVKDVFRTETAKRNISGTSLSKYIFSREDNDDDATQCPLDDASWQVVGKVIGSVNEPANKSETLSSATATNDNISGTTSASESWMHIPPLDIASKALLDLISTPGFQTFRRRSRDLEFECGKLENGLLGSAVEFLDVLGEYMDEPYPARSLLIMDWTEHTLQHDSNISTIDEKGENSTSRERIEMRKQALCISGEISAALRLLNEHALAFGSSRASSDGKSKNSPNRTKPSNHSTEIVAAVLEFFLDLVADQSRESISPLCFYWPQICKIHLSMLPARNADELIKVELIEDFLLSVCCLELQLALECVWGCQADLEEGMETAHNIITVNANPAEIQSHSRRSAARRFSVMRFICELESIMFNFDMGWGGGSVALRQVFNPSEIQGKLIRSEMMNLQNHRLHSRETNGEQERIKLSRSIRTGLLKKYIRGIDDSDVNDYDSDKDGAFDKNWQRSAKLSQLCLKCVATMPSTCSSVVEAVVSIPLPEISREQMQSSVNQYCNQLSFLRRLGDIAEKLHFVDVRRRPKNLQVELGRLCNSLLGGDPLSRSGSGKSKLDKVLNVPLNEGHVFRSKARTPVLLLMEIMREVDEESERDASEVPQVQKSLIEIENMSQQDVSAGTQSSVSSLKSESKADSMVSDPYLNDLSNDHDVLTGAENDCKMIPGISNSSEKSDEESNKKTSTAGSIPSIDTTLAYKVRCNSFDDGSSLHKSHVLNLNTSEFPRSPKLGEDEISRQVSTQSDGSIKEVENLVASTIQEKLSFPGNTVEDSEDFFPPKDSITNAQNKTLASTQDQGVSQMLHRSQRNLSTLSSLKFAAGSKCGPFKFGDLRREALTTILTHGMKGSSGIAQGAAQAAKRAVQAMDRRRAVELIVGQDTDENINEMSNNIQRIEQAILLDDSTIVTTRTSADEPSAPVTEEDEALEALRLLLIQNKVLKGKGSSNDSESDKHLVDAGEIDARLRGCGKLSPAILSALQLWKSKIISNGELLELARRDSVFNKQSKVHNSAKDKQEDADFWVRFAFGERWAEKKGRIAACSPHGAKPGWDLVSIIVKSNDDLRQEAFVMQLIEICRESFEVAGVECFVHPYRIVATSRSTGVIETVKNALSFDALKKRPGYENGGLRGHFKRMTEFATDPDEAFRVAQHNFVKSLAAYSLISYLFLCKDRHNGNLLLDTAGHVIHIDFGFVFGIAPGGTFSLEASTPFKLTEEMIEVMDGMGSPLFSEFVMLFCCGFIALQAHAETFLTLVEITCEDSPFPCFEGKNASEIVEKLRERFRPNLNKAQTVTFALDLIKQSSVSYGTKHYDFFQYLSQGIAA